MITRETDPEELAALHALDLLEGDERAAFEQHIATNVELRAQVDQLREAGMRIGLTATSPASPAPPARLRERVLSSAAPRARVVAFPGVQWWGWSLAALLTLSTLGLAALYFQTKAVLNAERGTAALIDLERQQLAQSLEAERLLSAAQINALLQAETRMAQLQLEADVAQLRIASLSSQLGDRPQARAVAVWHPTQQRGVLTVEQLPALAGDRDYQLWVIDPAYATPVDGGVFQVDPTTGQTRVQFATDRPVAEAKAFAVSLERKGGVPVAEGPMVLLSL